MQLINESNVLESGHYQNTNCKGKNDEMSLYGCAKYDLKL